MRIAQNHNKNLATVSFLTHSFNHRPDMITSLLVSLLILFVTDCICQDADDIGSCPALIPSCLPMIQDENVCQKEWDKTPHPKDCSKYLVCVQNSEFCYSGPWGQIERVCPKGDFFDNANKECVTVSECPGGAGKGGPNEDEEACSFDLFWEFSSQFGFLPGGAGIGVCRTHVDGNIIVGSFERNPPPNIPACLSPSADHGTKIISEDFNYELLSVGNTGLYWSEPMGKLDATNNAVVGGSIRGNDTYVIKCEDSPNEAHLYSTGWSYGSGDGYALKVQKLGEARHVIHCTKKMRFLLCA